jgi:fucose permease
MNRTRLITLTCCASFLALGISAALFGPAFQSLTQRFNLSLADGGLFVSLQWVGAASVTMLTGRLLDRANARYVLSAGPLLMGGGLVLLSVTPLLPLALCGSLLVGLGTGTLGAASNIVVAALNPRRAAAALNSLNMFFGLGAIAGPQIVNFALSRQQVSLAFITSGLFLVLLVIPFAQSSVHIHDEARTKSSMAMRWVNLAPFAALLFVYVGTEVGFGSWIFTQMTKVSLSTAAVGALATSVFFAGLTAGRLVATPVLRRLREDHLVVVSTGIMALGTGLLLAAPTVEAIGLLSAFLMGLGCGPVFPTAVALIGNLYPEQRGMATGMLMTIGSIGAILFPWLQGRIGGGNNGGMILPFAASLFCLVVAGLIRRHVSAEIAPDQALRTDISA